MVKKIVVIFILIIPQFLFSQEVTSNYSYAEYQDATKALITTFFFQGSLAVMALYMIFLYFQYKKKDYIYYGIYLSLFFTYFFFRIETVLKLNRLSSNTDFYFHLLLPLMFITVGVYIKFISVFADLEQHHKKFNKQLLQFTYLLYVIAIVILVISLGLNDYKIIGKYRPFIPAPVYLYVLYAIIRLFIVVKSKLKYYVLISNILLFTFSVIGIYSSKQFSYNENITSHFLFGFYSFNSAQFGTFLEMIGFSLGLGYKFSLVEKEKNEVLELSALKSKLYADISHEFRTPLTLISGPIEAIMNKGNLTDQDFDNFTMIKRNTNRLSSLVNQLLDLAKLDAGNYKLKLIKGNIDLFFYNISKSFEFKASRKNINYTIDIAPKITIWYDEDVIEKISGNLLSNAFKYCPNNGKCNFIVRKKNNTLTIIVKNSVKDLHESELETIFNRYYQKDKYNEGVGIGLSLVNELVNLYQGNISVELENQQEIIFTVNLPIKNLYII